MSPDLNHVYNCDGVGCKYSDDTRRHGIHRDGEVTSDLGRIRLQAVR